MSYQETVRYLGSFINYEKIPAYPYKESHKLERITKFLALINNPQNALKCIHVAGTKGKGSTCAFIAYILKEAGFKVGLYTSPHLSDFRERIRILSQKSEVRSQKSERDFEGMISKRDLCALTEQLKPAIEEFNKKSPMGALSFFEVYTALAFLYFKKKKVDFAVLETGLGGRLDATNAVSPFVCAITPLSYEHTQKLGNTLREIAAEKAGIIKSPFAPAITAPQKKEALKVIKDKCRETKAKLLEVGKDIKYRSLGSSFRVKTNLWEYKGLRIKLPGEHQLINAAVAIGAIEALRTYGINITKSAVRNGIANTVWPGRCEVISRNPTIVLDGAQNIASAAALKKAILGDFKYKKLILVLGISDDKDIKGVCNELSPLADEIILTKADNPRATQPEKLAACFKNKRVYLTETVKQAKLTAKSLSSSRDLILVTGSLFVVGEFRNEDPGK